MTADKRLGLPRDQSYHVPDHTWYSERIHALYFNNRFEKVYGYCVFKMWCKVAQKIVFWCLEQSVQLLCRDQSHHVFSGVILGCHFQSIEQSARGHHRCHGTVQRIRSMTRSLRTRWSVQDSVSSDIDRKGLQWHLYPSSWMFCFW